MSKKNVSSIVSGAGLLTTVWTALMEAVDRCGGSDEDIHRLATPDGKGHIEAMARAVVGSMAWQRPLQFLKALQEQSASIFRARETFFAKTTVKIIQRGGNFTTWFFDKKEERSVSQLLGFSLPRGMCDGEIITDLGGERMAESSLQQIWELLLQQPEGQEGSLLTNDFANVFYVRDAEGALRVLDVGWCDYGWSVDAGKLGLCGWDDVDRVFSCNSCLP